MLMLFLVSSRPRVIGGSLYQIACGARGRGERFEIFMSHCLEIVAGAHVRD